ncbi:RNA polymerase sigma factor [uncultured Tenacibaculum sp.]|uniref:RNA polymerase sigma factor n=1 Tax=uncultured Tenacibaculum sp. TaxID=174713 RepID=UPI00262E1CAD|nr:RNA polymerase sigma factor [uncultured Tenacibaculum sp.]
MAFSYVNSSVVAKDIAQESWGVIINKLNTLEDANKFKSWAIQIVKRKALDYLRKKQRQTKHITFYKEDVEIEEEFQGSVNEKKDKLSKAIKELKIAHQQVIRLFYVEERSLTEISELLKVSVSTVKSRLFHAREKLKNTIK